MTYIFYVTVLHCKPTQWLVLLFSWQYLFFKFWCDLVYQFFCFLFVCFRLCLWCPKIGHHRQPLVLCFLVVLWDVLTAPCFTRGFVTHSLLRYVQVQLHLFVCSGSGRSFLSISLLCFLDKDQLICFCDFYFWAVLCSVDGLLGSATLSQFLCFTARLRLRWYQPSNSVLLFGHCAGCLRPFASAY